MVPALLLLGNKAFGVSSNFRHLCAAIAPGRIAHFGYDWKKTGSWNLTFLLGMFLGAMAASILAPPNSLTLAPATVQALHDLGLRDLNGLAPAEVFSWASLLSVRGLAMIVGGGFLVGFGTAYAGGCTSGHSITGISNFQVSSIVATICFMIGGFITTWLLLPIIFKL